MSRPQVTYTTLIDGCVRGRVLDQAEALLDEMIAAGIRPNAVTFNALLHGHASSPDCDLKVGGPLLRNCCLVHAANFGQRLGDAVIDFQDEPRLAGVVKSASHERRM